MTHPRNIARSRAKRRRRLWQEDPHCWYCGRLLFWPEATLDHYHPQSEGGSDRMRNLRIACSPCNMSKGAALPRWLVCPIVPGRPVFHVVELYIRRLRPMTDKQAFDYEILKEKRTREAAQRHAAAIHELIRQTTAGIVETGREETGDETHATQTADGCSIARRRLVGWPAGGARISRRRGHVFSRNVTPTRGTEAPLFWETRTMMNTEKLRRQNFRSLLWELLDATDVHNRERPTREHKLAYSQWNMLNERFGATFRPGAIFPRTPAKQNADDESTTTLLPHLPILAEK